MFYRPDDVYSLLRYLLPSRIYYNEEYKPFLKAMSQLVATLWNDASKLPEVFDVEIMPDEFLKYLYEFWDYKYANFSYENFAQRMFLKNMMDILKKKGSNRAIVSAVQFSIMDDKDYMKTFIPDVHIEEGGSGFQPWEYMVVYPMGYNIDRSLYKYVKPVGQRDYLTASAHEDWWNYYYSSYDKHKFNADNDYKFYPNFVQYENYRDLVGGSRRVVDVFSLEGKVKYNELYSLSSSADSKVLLKYNFKPFEIYDKAGESLSGYGCGMSEIASHGKSDESKLIIYSTSSEVYDKPKIESRPRVRVDFTNEVYNLPKTESSVSVIMDMGEENYRDITIDISMRRLNLSRSNCRPDVLTHITRRVQDSIVDLRVK